jgi:hypothetical protein
MPPVHSCRATLLIDEIKATTNRKQNSTHTSKRLTKYCCRPVAVCVILLFQSTVWSSLQIVV